MRTSGLGYYKPTAGSKIAWDHPLARNIMCCYLFNENKGTRTWDLITGNFATLNSGFYWSGNQKGSTISNVGNDASCSLPNSILSKATTLTLSTVVYVDTLTNNLPLFDIAKSSTQYMRVYPYLSATGHAAFYTRNGGTATNRAIDMTVAFPLKRWCHFAVTIDGTTGKCYLDGQLNATSSIPYPPSTFEPSIYNYLNYYATAYGRGSFENFILWNRVLSDTEVSWLNREPYAFIRPQLAARYYVPVVMNQKSRAYLFA